jgi:hypothetical protein
MTARQDIASQLTHTNILATAARTATANGTGVDCRSLRGAALVILDCAAGTGTTPTLDLKLQDSADNSTFADITGAAFTQQAGTAARQTLSINLDGAARYVRAVSTIAGTTPSFTYSVNMVSF